MKKLLRSIFVAFVLLTILVSGCAPASTPVPLTLTPMPPTHTPVPTSTHTATPTDAPIPTSTSTQEPFKSIGSILSIAWSQDHEYKFDESGVTLRYSLQTDESKANEKIGLNINGFPDAEKTMAETISDAIFRSYFAYQQSGTPTKADYDVFMKLWALDQTSNENNLKMRVKAYVDGEIQPRIVEANIPNYIIPIIFVSAKRMERIEPPVIKSDDNVTPLRTWILIQKDQIYIVVGSPVASQSDAKPMIEEALGLSHALAALRNVNNYTIYWLDLFTNLDGDGKIILKVIK
jgi:hypothetical protein